jgi:hypothetical protein
MVNETLGYPTILLQISAHAETAVYAGIASNDGDGSNQGEGTPI